MIISHSLLAAGQRHIVGMIHEVSTNHVQGLATNGLRSQVSGTEPADFVVRNEIQRQISGGEVL